MSATLFGAGVAIFFAVFFGCSYLYRSLFNKKKLVEAGADANRTALSLYALNKVFGNTVARVVGFIIGLALLIIAAYLGKFMVDHWQLVKQQNLFEVLDISALQTWLMANKNVALTCLGFIVFVYGFVLCISAIQNWNYFYEPIEDLWGGQNSWNLARMSYYYGRTIARMCGGVAGLVLMVVGILCIWATLTKFITI
jgi:hypothetical protein